MAIKLIFFDVEGTIYKKLYRNSIGNTAPSMWQLLFEKLGSEALKAEIASKRKWVDGGYAGYVEWMAHDLALLQKYGLDKSFFEEILKSVDYNPGVKEAFNQINKKGYITGLISGGFKAHADIAQVELKITHAFSGAELFWNSSGELIHWNMLPCDYEGKVDFMKLIINEHGLKASECAFVGDGKNDIALAKEVGLSICFNGPKELQDACTFSVIQDDRKIDFREILKWL